MAGFLLYRKSDKRLLGNSGYPVRRIPYEKEVQIESVDPESGEVTIVTTTRPSLRDYTGDDGIQAIAIPNYGGVLADYGSVELTDEQMAECYSAASYVVQFDGDMLSGVTKYAWATLTCPQTATVGVSVDVSVSAEGGDGVEAILCIDGVEQVRGLMPATWQVQFDSVGIYLVEINAGRHGVVRREVVAS